MTLDIDTSDFNAMCDELSTRLKAPPEEVIREEVGRVLSKTIDNTDAADADKIRRHNQQATNTLQSASLYTPKQPGRRRLVKGRVLYNLSWHYPDRLWSAIQLKRAEDLNRRIAARGLAKRSWLRIGQLLGVKVEAPAYVKKAVARTGKIYPEDERATVERSDSRITFTLENSQPTVNAINGDQALQRAVDGRTNYFLTNVAKGVFDSLDKAAKKYPGVTTHG